MNPLIKKYNDFLLLLEDPRKLEIQVNKFFEEEFIELFDDILIKSDKDFIENLLFNAKFVIEDNFSSEAMNNSTLIQIIKKKEREFYVKFQNDKERLTKVLKYKGKDFIENGQNFSFLKHCIFQNNNPIHMCNEKNNFVTVLSEKSVYINKMNNHRRNSFTDYKDIYAIICTKCLKAYKADYIKLFCKFCKIPYYTRILSFNENANNNLQPATWEKYHCNIIINQQMECPKCNQPLFIDIENDKLVCQHCNFYDDAENIEWKCIKCKNKFFSHAKIYNPYIFKPFANAIKKGLLEKISAIPKRIQCGHNPDNIVHKKNCDGKLYITELNNTEMILCSKCRAMSKFDKFIFECPECGKKFKANEENLEEEFKIFSNCVTPKMKKSINFSKSNSKNDVPKISTSRTNLNNINDCNSEKKKIRYAKHASTNCLQYSTKKKLSSGISNANTTNTENINKDSYGENNEKDNNFIIPQKKISVKNNVVEFDKNYTNNYNSVRRQFSRSLVIKTNQNIKDEDDYYCSSSDDEFEDGKNTFQRKNSNCEKNIDNKIINNCKTTFENKENLQKINSNDLPNFEPSDYMIISQIGEGKKSKIFCVKSDDNTFYAMKKKVLIHKNDLEHFLYCYKLQYNLMTNTNVTKIYSINFTNEEFSVLEELGINSWNSEIATMKKMKKFYSEEDLVNIIYQITSTLEVLQRKDLCHFNINPKNIIVCKDKLYKLNDLEYIRAIKDVNIIPNDNNFISPQLYELYYEKKSHKGVFNLVKNDVYSLGLCIIYTMTRTNEINNIFKDFISKKHNIDSDKLVGDYFKYPLNTMDDDNFYSIKLEILLQNMLKFREDERFDFIQINEYITKEYEFED